MAVVFAPRQIYCIVALPSHRCDEQTLLSCYNISTPMVWLTEPAPWLRAAITWFQCSVEPPLAARTSMLVRRRQAPGDARLAYPPCTLASTAAQSGGRLNLLNFINAQTNDLSNGGFGGGGCAAVSQAGRLWTAGYLAGHV